VGGVARGLGRRLPLLLLVIPVPVVFSSGAPSELASLEGIRVRFVIHRHSVQDNACGGFLFLDKLEAAREELVASAAS
jgi:hypothetical protein